MPDDGSRNLRWRARTPVLAAVGGATKQFPLLSAAMDCFITRCR
jgi:hypothetical protein